MNNNCERCNKSFNKVPRGLGNLCRECDTSSAGTWMLSYLSELDYIVAYDDVRNGSVYGTIDNNFLDLANGTEIYCSVDEYDRTLFHAKCDIIDPKKKDDSESEEWDDVFWEKPDITKIDFRVNLGIQIIKPASNVNQVTK